MDFRGLMQKLEGGFSKQKKDIEDVFSKQIDFNNLIVYTFLGMIFTLFASFFVYFLTEIVRLTFDAKIYIRYLLVGLVISIFICLSISYYMGYSFHKVRQEQKRSRNTLNSVNENLRNLKI